MNFLKYFIFISLATQATIACAQEKPLSNLPLSIDDVKTQRVNKRLVRTIQYNRIELPLLEFELIKAPDRELVHKIEVNSITITFDGRQHLLDFNERAAVDFEEIRIEGNEIKFNVGYTAATHTAPYIISECKIDIEHNSLSKPTCSLLQWGAE
ncbi:MAG: hypothetical protein OEY89_17160 [Gammaproteobacteria bacterium]|nr:hypothetical protein [Gammaproteobacteria bacterium]